MEAKIIHGILFIAIKNDVNGNPRYKIYLPALLTNEELNISNLIEAKKIAKGRAKKLGYRCCKDGIEFIIQSYALHQEAKKIAKILNTKK